MGQDELLKKIKEKIIENKKKLLLVLSPLVIIIIAYSIIINSIKNSNNTTFYPQINANNLESIYKMFSNKNYLGLTSYVDSIIPTLNEEEKKIALFYKGEALFLEKSYDEAYKIFSSINKISKQLWQAEFRIGCIALIQGNLDIASDYIGNINLENPEVYYWKGRLEETMGNLDKAISYFKKSYSNDSFFRIGKILFHKKDYQNAVYYLSQIADINEYKEEAIKIIIDSYENLNDINNELIWLDKLLKIKQITEYTIKKGILLRKIGKSEEAYYTINPIIPIIKDKNTILNFANICFDTKRYDEAFKYYKEVEDMLEKNDYKNYIESSIKSKNYNYTPQIINSFIDKYYIEDKTEIYKLYTYMVEAYINNEDYDKALKYAKELINIEANSDSYIMLARIYKAMGEERDYILALREAARINSIYNKDLIESLIEMKEYETASNFVKEILSKDPYNIYFLYTKARLEIKQKNIEDALKTLYKLTDLKIEDNEIKAKAYYLLGSLLFYRDKYKEAIKYLEISYKIKVDTDTGLNLAYSFILNNNIESAINTLNQLKSFETDPIKISKIYSLLAYASKKNNDISSLRFYLDKAIEFDKNNTLAQKLMKEINRK
ncbi:MAG TPA: hypothetical protein PKW55_01595 [Spirochaetota bacterium]|nr:hypothetical protein [Spirochaetota bacterium]HOM38911.1 hypothetical protein [Spirochaetota bacterium]HPQ49110.1 hypothetical protein [Spirochaetota bacterium]